MKWLLSVAFAVGNWLCSIQMVGVTNEEVEAMGKDWTGDYFQLLTTHCYTHNKVVVVHVQLHILLQFMGLPEELLTEICKYLDPRSRLHLTQAHPHFSELMDAMVLWKNLRLTSNWLFHNETFVFIRCFSTKVETVVIDHTGRTPTYIVLYAEASLSFMPNLTSLSVTSPYFEFCHFLRRTRKIQVLEFKSCPRFDVESFMECVTATCVSQLQVLDLRGVTGVSSMDMWCMSAHLPRLSKLYLTTVMSDIFAEEIFENCQQLTHFDCIAPAWCIPQWKALVDRYSWIQLGAQLWAHLWANKAWGDIFQKRCLCILCKGQQQKKYWNTMRNAPPKKKEKPWQQLWFDTCETKPSDLRVSWVRSEYLNTCAVTPDKFLVVFLQTLRSEGFVSTLWTPVYLCCRVSQILAFLLTQTCFHLIGQ